MFMRGFILSAVLLLFLLPITSSAEEPVGFYMTGEASVFALDLPEYAAATVKAHQRSLVNRALRSACDQQRISIRANGYAECRLADEKRYLLRGSGLCRKPAFKTNNSF